MIRHFLTRQFLRFAVVGGIAAVLHWSARFGLSHWLPFGWAVFVAYAVGMAVAFVLNSFLVFPRSQKARSAQARDFILVNLAFLPVVWVLSLLFNAGLTAIGMPHHSEELAHALAIPVPMLATFLIYKFFAFKDTRHE